MACGVWSVIASSSAPMKRRRCALDFFGSEIAQGCHPFRDDWGRDGRLGVESPGSGAGAGRKRKQVQVAERETANELDCFVEFAFGFAGEACHDIGAEGEIWSGGAKERGDFLGVVPGAVAAVHAAKHGIRAGLQGKVRMAGQASSTVFGHEGDEIGIPIHGLDGTQAETREVGLVEDLAHERSQSSARLAGLVRGRGPSGRD